jgi:CheY-like chemotaxis protein
MIHVWIPTVDRRWSVQGRVLLIDDEPATLTSYSRALIGGGFEATEADNGEEALRRLDTMNYDVVLTDLLIPNRSRTARMIRQLRSLDYRIEAPNRQPSQAQAQ